MLPTSSKRNWRGWDERCSRLVAQSAQTTKAAVMGRQRPAPGFTSFPGELKIT